MRILFVNERCGWKGGVEQNVADTAVGLRERGHTCALAYGFDTDRAAEGYRRMFDEARSCAEAGAPGGEGLREAIARFRPDATFFHKIARLPVESLPSGHRAVRMIHDHDLCCPRRHKYFAFSKRVCRHRADWRCWLDLAFLRRDPAAPLGVGWNSIPGALREIRANHRLDAAVVGSRFMAREIEQSGFPPEKVHIVPPLVRMEQTGAVPMGDEPRVLYVGQLIAGKGVDLLLRSLCRIDAPFHCDIVGAGNAEAKLRKMCAALGLGDRVAFHGWVPHDGLARFYSSARLVAVPSRWPEPFGMIGVEAMLHGRPVVGFAVGGIRDWLTDGVNGFSAAEGDVGAFADGLGRLLRDRKLAARLGAAGRERAARVYDPARCLDRIETLLRG